ncbi:MAG: hypothetical protein PVH88_12175 [Ignavibacteria bacterium]|jgi:opacity protein-like surface antigen
MVRRSLAVIVALCIYPLFTNAQIQRTEALGGLSYSILDRDMSLSPYNFGNNPAWLSMDEKEDFLKIQPSVSSLWGDYKRKYDAERVNDYGISFTGVKTLGEKGTFYGSTEYTYEMRKDYYKTIRKEPYAGDAFNILDSASGDFRYNGPNIKLMYSWELFPNLYAGGYFFYHMLDGLKQTYSYSKTIYRNTGGGLGLAYCLSDNLVLGASLEYFNEQEAIESEDINQIGIESYIYRGESYYITKSGTSEEQKIKASGVNFSGQLYWDAGENLKIGLQANYEPSDSKILIPNDETDEEEFEDCYASFESYDAQLKLQYSVADVVIGAYCGFFHDDSWTRITAKDVLIWDWNTDRIAAGIGSSYKITNNLLVGAEYELTNSDIDSSKYIDRKSNEFTSMCHTVKVGLEYEVTGNVFLRTGYNYCFEEHDLLFGGIDVSYNAFTLGMGYYLLDWCTLDAYIGYARRSPGEISNYNRSNISGVVTLTLNSF